MEDRVSDWALVVIHGNEYGYATQLKGEVLILRDMATLEEVVLQGEEASELADELDILTTSEELDDMIRPYFRRGEGE